MQFQDADHECDVQAEFGELEIVDEGRMLEREGTCQECGRTFVDEYEFRGMRDTETGEFVQHR